MTKEKDHDIPRCMHQIWLQGENHLRDTQPRLFKFMCRARQWCKKSGWTHHLWCEREGLKLLNPRQKQIYDSAPSFAAQADILRYAILYAHGGLYLDMDVLILKRHIEWIFKDLVPKEEVVIEHAFHHNPTELAFYGRTNNAFIASRRHSTMVQRMLQFIEQSQEFKSWWGKRRSKSLRALMWTLRVTGPKAFEEVMYSAPARVRFLPTGLVGCHTMLTQRMHGSPDSSESVTQLVTALKQAYPSLLFYHFAEGSWTNPSLTNAAFSLRAFLAQFAIIIIVVLVIGLIVLMRAKRKKCQRRDLNPQPMG